MTNFSKGKYAQFISDRSGMAFPYKEMVVEWNGARVHISEYEPKQPQLQPKPVGADPQGLPQARPARVEFSVQDILRNNPFTTSFKRADELFQVRMFKHFDDNLFTTKYALREGRKMHKDAQERLDEIKKMILLIDSGD